MSDQTTNETPRSRSPKYALVSIVTGLVLVVALLGFSLTRTSSSPSSTSSTTSTTAPVVSMTTIVSTLAPRGGYATPGGKRVTTVFPKWKGAPLVMPVVRYERGYFLVRLPGRPNGSTTWISAKGLLVTKTPYRIIISISKTHLELLKNGKVVLNVPVGVGTVQYPTPIGNFFVAFYAAPTDYSYGPFVMVTSAHSDTITDWEGTGDAMVAIHGPLGADNAIGTTGARVSHGCIRMHRVDQEKLQVVPIGTPISIIR